MEIKEKINLKPYTTFKIGGFAEYFCEVEDQFDALTAFEFAAEKKLQVFILGGGSNLLISDKGFGGLVVRVINKGIEIISKSQGESESDTIYLKVASGENWDSVVEFAVKNNWWGMENLSHIPGSTGAIAVQNVGAYGQEAKNIIDSVTVFDTKTRQILNLAAKDCGFEYRKSMFNNSQKGRYIIFYITFKLSKTPKPLLEYKDLKKSFSNTQAKTMQLLSEIRQAVISIRDKKFPFPTQAKNGNAGSFFKNLILSGEEYLALKAKVEVTSGSEASQQLENKKFNEGNIIKIPTAFLMDICDLKNLEEGGAAINHNQPLVIINKNGKATAENVLNLAKKVKNTVYKRLGINIHIEPELLGFSPEELNGII